MIKRGGIFWIQCLLCMVALSSCSSLKRSAGKTNNTAGKDNRQVQFLDDITMSRNGKRSEHHYNGRNVGISKNVNRSSAILENAQQWQFKYAQLLDVPVEDVLNGELYGFIEEWWATPYRLGGKSKTGIDCSNFVNTLLTSVFQLNVTGNSVQLYEKAKKLSSKQMREGDLVFFHINKNKRISHVGVYLENDKFVHASTSSGVMISDLNEPYWKKYYAGAGRVE